MPYSVKSLREVDGYNYNIWVGCKELSNCVKNSDDGCSAVVEPVGL